MKGDFTRDTFDSIRHFSRVLMQQGRVQLDADFNEQTAILLRYLRMMMVDLIGPYGGPANPDGTANEAFKITPSGTDIKIKAGRYYVDGIPCENDSEATYSGVRDVNKSYYAYLDVWERHITHIQDDRIREKALGGPDTCSRAKVVWQARLHEASDNASAAAKQKLERELKALEAKLEKAKEAEKKKIQIMIKMLKKRIESLGTTTVPSCSAAQEWLDRLPKVSDALMKARVQPERGDDNACSIPPESRYRGAENQLYRIEIHRGGVAWDGTVGEGGKPAGNVMQAATIKWSRDNGSIVFPIVHQQGNIVTVQSLGRDERTSLKIGDWVEIMDDDRDLQGIPGIIAQVDRVDLVEMTVTLKLPDDVPSSGFLWPVYDEKSAKHPLLRRWDHRAIEGVTLYQGATLATESSDPDSGWIEIENGVEVQFQPPINPVLPRQYRTGDYWLIPARVATGKIEWPPKLDNEGQIVKDANGYEIPEAMPPHGIEHHYAPLAVVRTGQQQAIDCRCTFHPLPCKGA